MTTSLFFSGIGGSGMQALARLMLNAGYVVAGSDRAYDQGVTPDKFDRLADEGIHLYPQDGSGVTADMEAVIVSSAIEDRIPDIQQARALGVPIRRRAEVLAEHVNARRGIAIAGTSGKTTITGMTGWILYNAGLGPTIVNGGIMRNDFGAGADSNFVAGARDWFVTETDESDGSIDDFYPEIAVLSNIARDHHELDSLNDYFARFVARASSHVVLNADDPGVARIAGQTTAPVCRYGIEKPDADLTARDIRLTPGGSAANIYEPATGAQAHMRLNVPGRHNISNALAALAAARCAGVGLKDAVGPLEQFAGIARRLEKIGRAAGAVVYDDFAHNPDKIAASLATLKQDGARLHVIFQPHGFGPMAMMRQELVTSFADGLAKDDRVYLPAIYYAGGTASAQITSADIADGLQGRGVAAEAFDNREAIIPALAGCVSAGDIIAVMGARDDSLSVYARDICAEMEMRLTE
jgi:UDP-N-acetylmuramate--alanine ligase